MSLREWPEIKKWLRKQIALTQFEVDYLTKKLEEAKDSLFILTQIFQKLEERGI